MKSRLPIFALSDNLVKLDVVQLHTWLITIYSLVHTSRMQSLCYRGIWGIKAGHSILSGHIIGIIHKLT